MHRGLQLISKVVEMDDMPLFFSNNAIQRILSIRRRRLSVKTIISFSGLSEKAIHVEIIIVYSYHKTITLPILLSEESRL